MDLFRESVFEGSIIEPEAFVNDRFGIKICGKAPQVEFVETPPEDLICQICRDVLRLPHVTDCCGQHLCKSCLDSSVNEYTNINACPYCREKCFNHLIYKPYQRRINELKVYCSNKSEGCMKVLEYKDLEQHIDKANSTGCLYTTIDCPNLCLKEFLRKDLEDHVKNTCRNRLVNCEYCDFEMKWHCLTEHYVECDKYPVLCPRNCSDGMLIREQLVEHEKQCPNVVVECPFQEAGCKDEVTRAQLTAHLDSNMADHLGKLMTAYCQLKVEFQSLKNDYEKMKTSESFIASPKDSLPSIASCIALKDSSPSIASCIASSIDLSPPIASCIALSKDLSPPPIARKASISSKTRKCIAEDPCSFKVAPSYWSTERKY